MWVMNTKQILFTIAIIAAISPATVVAPVMAQNMTGGNMTGGNMTGGNMTGKISGGFDFAKQQAEKCIPPEVKLDPFTCGIPGGSLTQEDYSAKYGQQMAQCTPPEVEVSEGKCGIDQSRQGDGSADTAAATAADDDDGGDTNSGDGGGTDSGDGGEGQDGGEDEGQGEDDEKEQEGGN